MFSCSFKFNWTGLFGFGLSAVDQKIVFHGRSDKIIADLLGIRRMMHGLA
jgi:hypothetical protein